MAYEGYQFLKIRVDRGVAFVTIDNPPINLLTLELSAEILRLAGEIVADDEVKVTVFDSANPDFFIAHFDVNVLAAALTEVPVGRNRLHLLLGICIRRREYHKRKNNYNQCCYQYSHNCYFS